MKLNTNVKLRCSTIRTLDDFCMTIISLLQNKAIDDIRVGELCDLCNYPRSTFYEYFDDIYDLIEYCPNVVVRTLNFDDYKVTDLREDTKRIFEYVYDFVISLKCEYIRILSHNKKIDFLVEAFKKCIKDKVRGVLDTYNKKRELPIPFKILSEHYINTCELVLQQCFDKSRNMTKEDAIECLDFLLTN